MERTELLDRLKKYVSEEILEGRDVGLEFDSPLLEWGIINSFEMMKLMKYIRESVGVELSASALVAENFKDLEAIADLILLEGKDGV